MSYTASKVIRLATALGAAMWLARLVFSPKARNDAKAAMQAVDEATTSMRSTKRFGGLAGRVKVSDDFDASLRWVQQEQRDAEQRKGRPAPITPLPEVILERAKSFGREAYFTVALQHRRLRTTEPEDDYFAFRWHADLQLLIAALRRLRRAAELAASVPDVDGDLLVALGRFDEPLPDLAKMRNVGEHIDDYLMGRGRAKNVHRSSLQVSSWDGTVIKWLDGNLDTDAALSPAQSLFAALARSVKHYNAPLPRPVAVENAS